MSLINHPNRAGREVNRNSVVVHVLRLAEMQHEWRSLVTAKLWLFSIAGPAARELTRNLDNATGGEADLTWSLVRSRKGSPSPVMTTVKRAGTLNRRADRARHVN